MALYIPEIIFFFIVLWFAWRGFSQGLAVAASRIAALIFSYVATFLFVGQTIKLIESNTSYEGVVVVALAGTLTFILAFVLLSIIFSVVISLGKLDKTKEGKIRLPAVGAVFNGAVGIVMGLLAVWCFLLLEQGVKIKSGKSTEPRAETWVSNAANGMVGYGIQWLIGLNNKDNQGKPSMATDLAEYVSENPVRGLQDINSVMKNKNMRTLMTDPNVVKKMKEGRVNELMKEEAFKELTQDPAIKRLMNAELKGASEKEKQEKMASLMTGVMQGVDRMKGDEKFQAAINNPEVQKALQSGSVVELLKNGEIKNLIGLIGDMDLSVKGPDKGNQESKQSSSQSEIIKWQDENGRWHFSNTPVPEVKVHTSLNKEENN